MITESLRSQWKQLLFALLGYGAAWGLAGVITAVQYARMDPAVLRASGGMVAFGSMLGFLAMGVLFSLVPTVFVLRRWRGTVRYGPILRSLGWLIGLTVPTSLAIEGLNSAHRIPNGSTVEVLAFLTLLLSPIPFFGFASASVLAADGSQRRQLRWLTCLAGTGILALGWSMLRSSPH